MVVLTFESMEEIGPRARVITWSQSKRALSFQRTNHNLKPHYSLLSSQSIAGKSVWHQPLPSAGKPLHAKISFCFTSDWSRIWLETLKPITKRSGETIYLHPFWLTKSITLVWVVRHLTENWSWPYWLYWHKVSVNNRMCLWRFSCVFWIILQLVAWPILFFSV